MRNLREKEAGKKVMQRLRIKGLCNPPRERIGGKKMKHPIAATIAIITTGIITLVISHLASTGLGAIVVSVW